MGNERQRRREARSPESRTPSPSPSPLRRRLGGERVSVEEEEERRMETEMPEVMPVERETTEEEEEGRRQKDEGGGGTEAEKEREATEEVLRGETNTDNIRLMFWDSLSSEEEFWSAGTGALQKFAFCELENPLLADLVVDALFFELIYPSQKFWFCYLCGCYFADGDSLTMHLKKHIPLIGKCQAWPSPHKRDRESVFVQESLRKLVWKPINVQHALQQFYTLCLDAKLEAAVVFQEEMEWPWSDDDSERSKLLTELGRELNALASYKNGLSFLSSGPLRHLIAVASRHILVRLPPRDLVLDFTRQLASSPLSFCFLEKESLCHFVRVAKTMSQFVKDADLDCDSTSACAENEASSSVSSCKMSDDSPNYTISILSPDSFLFVLEPANCQYESLHSWLRQKPSEIPCTGPLQLPSDLPAFLTHISHLSGVCQHFIDIMGERISYFHESEANNVVPKAVDFSIVSKWSHEALLEAERSDVENNQLSDWFSVTDLESMRNEHLPEADFYSLKVVELLCNLQSWEFKIRRLCTFDFCSYIVPLMQQYLQKCSDLSSKKKRAAEFGCIDQSSSSSECHTPSRAFPYVNKEYHPNMFISIAGGGVLETDNSGLFICVYLSDLMQDIKTLGTQEILREAMNYVRIHKTWRYWYCYSCRERFPDSESHMEHMDKEHKLYLPCDEQPGLVPRLPSKHEVDQLLGLELMQINSPFETCSYNYRDNLEKCVILKRMKELLCNALEDESVLFSASSHLIHLVEFARDELFRVLRRDEKKLKVAKEIDETSKLVFSMYDTGCLQRVEEFLECLCKQCNSSQMQTQESYIEKTNYLPHAAACGIFYAGPSLQVDPTIFAEAFSRENKAAEEKHKIPFVTKTDILVKIEERLDDLLISLRGHFDAKRQVLGKLDVVFALDRMLIRESDHAGILRSRYEMLDSMDPAAKGSFQYHLISQLLCGSSSFSVEEALKDAKDKLLSELDVLDVEIMQELAQINKLKREISDLCFCDYSTDILPVIGVFLKPRIRLDGDLMSWASNKLQEMLCSIDHSDLSDMAASFRITSVSIGKVFVNIRACKWGLEFDYNKMRLNFEGEWLSVLQGKRTNGYVDFVGSSDWHRCKNKHMKAEATVVLISGKTQVNFLELAPSLREAVCAKLLKFQEEFIEKSIPCLPHCWYKGGDCLPYPNQPHNGLNPLKNIKSDCLHDVTMEYRCLKYWKLLNRQLNEDA